MSGDGDRSRRGAYGIKGDFVAESFSVIQSRRFSKELGVGRESEGITSGKEIAIIALVQPILKGIRRIIGLDEGDEIETTGRGSAQTARNRIALRNAIVIFGRIGGVRIGHIGGTGHVAVIIKRVLGDPGIDVGSSHAGRGIAQGVIGIFGG